MFNLSTAGPHPPTVDKVIVTRWSTRPRGLQLVSDTQACSASLAG